MEVSGPRTIANSLQSAPIYQKREILTTFLNFQNWGLRGFQPFLDMLQKMENPLLFLDDSLLEVTALALDAVRKELGRAAGIVLEMMDRFHESFAKNDFEALQNLVKNCRTVGCPDQFR